MLYVDDRATDAQHDALTAIFLGRAGGTVAAQYGPGHRRGARHPPAPVSASNTPSPAEALTSPASSPLRPRSWPAHRATWHAGFQVSTGRGPSCTTTPLLHRSGIALGGSRSGRTVRDRLRLSIRPLTPHGVTCPLARRNRDRLGTYVDLSLPHNNVPESRDAPRLEGRVGGAFAMRRSIASITEVVAALSSALRIRNRIAPPARVATALNRPPRRVVPRAGPHPVEGRRSGRLTPAACQWIGQCTTHLPTPTGLDERPRFVVEMSCDLVRCS